MRATVARVIAVGLIIGAGFPVNGLDDAVPLQTVIDDLGLTFGWDSVRGFGIVRRGRRTISFRTDMDVAVEDYSRLVRVETPFRENGSLQAPEAFVEVLRSRFPERIGEPVRSIGAIYVDPGHGGIDPGTIGRHRIDGTMEEIQEKDVVLSVSEALVGRLSRAFQDKIVELSRETDVYLTLEERTELANRLQEETGDAVLFVSIHANASLNKEARGFEVWYLPLDYRRRNLVTETQTGVDDPDVLAVLNTLREEELSIESVLLAKNISAGLEVTIGDRSPNRGLKEESWYVVRNAKMPSVLVEIGFVTNVDEFKLLQSEDYLSDIVEGIYNGIVAFVGSYEELTIVQ